MTASTNPNFVVIGPGKAGTTWIYQALKQHPDVCMAASKETLFFQDYYEKGREWYEAFFGHCRPGQITGEVSNTYIFHAEVAERIHDYAPHARLITSLRSPVDRAFSHYLYLLRNVEVSGSFEEALVARPDLLEKGMYHAHLSAYLRHFPREQLLVLLFDDLKRDPAGFARRLFEFLGVDPSFRPDAVDRKVLAAARPRSKPVAWLVKRAALAARGLGLARLVTMVKDSAVPGMLYQAYGRDEYPQMRPETRARLERHFSDDLQRLSALLDRDLSALWLGGAA